MKRMLIIATFYFILSGIIAQGEESLNASPKDVKVQQCQTDPYILLSTDPDQSQYVESVCSQLQLPPVKSFSQEDETFIVVGPFLHGVMAYENLQVIKTHIPEARLIRLSKGEERIDFVHASANLDTCFLTSSRLGQSPTSTYLSQDFSNYYDTVNALKTRPDYLQEIQSLKSGLSDTDPEKGVITKFEADYLYNAEFSKLGSGNASFDEAKSLYQKLARNELISPREMRGHSAIKLIFIDQAENRTEVWVPNPDSGNPDAYFRVYQTCRDAYDYLDDERFRPEAAVHKIAKMLELAYRFNIGNYDDVRKAIESVKSDLPSSETIRLIEKPIMSNMEFIVRKYRYNMSTLELIYAETYYYEKNYQKAYEGFREVSEKYPDIPRQYLASLQWRGLMAMNLGMDDDAIESFEKAVNDRSPENNENTFGKRNPRSNSGFWLGQIYLKRNRKEEVKSLYETILKKYPNCKEKEFMEKCLITLEQ